MTVSFTRRWPTAIRALRHRDFRYLWIGFLVSAVGTWMQIVAQSLLVLQLTHNSAFALGVMSLSQAVAFFTFALAGGGLADRVDRRRLLLVTQSLLLTISLLMGLLTLAGAIRVWMIVIFVFVAGAVLSFDQPARAALIASLVPKEDLLNAISLQSAVFNGASTIGPALAGIAVAELGLPVNFFLNSMSFCAVLIGLLLIRNRTAMVKNRLKWITQIREALGTVKRDAVLPRMLLSYGTLLFFGPSLQLLLPVLAVRVLHVPAGTLGLLFSGAGLGAILGALLIGTLSQPSNRIVGGAFALWTGSLVVIAFSRNVPATFVALIIFGLSQSVVGAITSTLLQTRVPPEQRGRVMSLNTLLVMGVRPLGDFPTGALMSIWGAPVAVAASALVVGSVASVSLIRRLARRAI